jgi:hypothetical protein
LASALRPDVRLAIEQRCSKLHEPHYNHFFRNRGNNMGTFWSRIAFLMVLQGISIGGALAADKVVMQPVVADTLDNFAPTAAQIRDSMGSGGRYEFIGPEDKVKANAYLDAMAEKLQKSGSVAAMPEAERAQLLNIQAHLNTILAHSDRNRLVCVLGSPTGSNIPLTTCKTFAELEKAHHDAQRFIHELEHRSINSRGGN